MAHVFALVTGHATSRLNPSRFTGRLPGAGTFVKQPNGRGCMSFAWGEEVASERHPAEGDLAVIQAERNAEGTYMHASAVRKERQARATGRTSTTISHMQRSALEFRSCSTPEFYCEPSVRAGFDFGRRPGKDSSRNERRMKLHARKRCPQGAPGTHDAKNLDDDLTHGAVGVRIPQLNNSGILLRALCARAGFDFGRRPGKDSSRNERRRKLRAPNGRSKAAGPQSRRLQSAQMLL